jgi:hypothetical protein
MVSVSIVSIRVPVFIAPAWIFLVKIIPIFDKINS